MKPRLKAARSRWARKVGRIEAGAKADLLVLDSRHPLLANVKADDIPRPLDLCRRQPDDPRRHGRRRLGDPGRPPSDEIEAGRPSRPRLRPLFED
jgi:cytosine/adenosine deaminase-related metal-dependent hydrolase